MYVNVDWMKKKCNSDQWKNDSKNKNKIMKIKVSVKSTYLKKILFGILLHVCKNIKHLASTMDDSAIMCDEIIDAEAK